MIIALSVEDVTTQYNLFICVAKKIQYFLEISLFGYNSRTYRLTTNHRYFYTFLGFGTILKSSYLLSANLESRVATN